MKGCSVHWSAQARQRHFLNQQRLGIDHVAFAEVKLSDTREKALASFNSAVRIIDKVEECHMTAGALTIC
jgi:Lrp/AsnC family leucine-responsive transcriptional regulator